MADDDVDTVRYEGVIRVVGPHRPEEVRPEYSHLYSCTETDEDSSGYFASELDGANDWF